MNIVLRLLAYTKQSLLLLSIACVGVLTSTTNVSAASFPSYTLTKDGTLSISGGGISNWKSSGSSLELEIDGAEFYAEDIATKSSYCTGGNNKASVRVAVAPDASAPTSVVQVYALCAAGGAIGEYSDEAWWTDGSRPIKNDTGISPGDPPPSPPGGVGGQETYSFNHGKSKSGEYILACSGMFRQFNEVGAPGTDLESCVELKAMGTGGGEDTDFTWHVKLTVPNSHRATYGCSGAAPFRYDFYIRTDTPPSIDADGMMAATIESKPSDNKHCSQLELKGTLDSPKDILIMGGNELDDLLGEPIGSGEDAQSLCQVEGGLGWILCPVMNTVASINDEAFGLIENFLVIPPMMTGSGTSNAYAVWQAIRNIANVLFAFAFIIIVYSQLTSAGISNYGIKKMLPKMIVGVILVNASYWIVALSIDLSNVVGSSIYEVMRGFGGNPEVGGAAIPSWQNTTANLLAFTGVVVVGVMVGLSVLLPMAVSALFMLMGLVFVLTFRHAMVFILAIISPLAFVAYMLPNTEGMFKTWFKLFRVLLYIYPAVGFIMGASVIAASVMFSVSQTIEDNAIARWTMMAIATAMPAMGIFAALMLAKTMGSVASKLGINNPLAPAINAAKGKAGSIGKGIDDTTKNSFKSATLGYANKHRGSKSRFRKASVLAAGAAGGGIGGYLKSRAATTKSNYETAQTVYDEEGGFADKLTKQQQQQRENRIIASATQKGSEHGDSLELANKTDEDLDKMSMGSAETLKALKQQRHGAMMSVADSMHSDLSNDEVSKIASSGYLDLANKEKANRAQVAAAQIRIMKTGSFQERHDALSYMAAHKGDFSEEVRNTVAQEAIKRGDNNIYGPAFGNEIVKQHGLIKGTDSLKDAAIKNAESGKVTPEHMVQNGASTNYIIESVMNSGNTDAINNVKAAADSARTSSSTAGRVSEEFDKAFQKIGSFGGGASAPQSPQPPSAPAAATNPTPTSSSSGSLTINHHVGAPVTNPAPGSPSNPNGGNTNNTP